MTTACAPGETPVAADWKAIGTMVRLVVTDPARLETARRLLTSYLAALDLACSRFRDDSELAAAERAGGTPVRVSEVLADAVGVALYAAEITDGDVDPTVATAMADLGYDRDFELMAKDGPPIRLSVRHRPSWRDVRLDRHTRMLTIPDGIRLDLGATAKARASDRAAQRLADRLGCGVLVSLGGDIAVGGEPPEGGWRVRVQDITGHPDDPPSGPAAVVAITAGGLATSGIAARRWRRGTVTLHHILDPRSGLPVTPVWRTVSVAADSAFYANVASTTAIIRGEAAVTWLENLRLPARLVKVDGTVQSVAGWPVEVPA
ncbi:MAG: FAD:protein FMN transferase [Micromonosporaceae bacterium]